MMWNSTEVLPEDEHEVVLYAEDHAGIAHVFLASWVEGEWMAYEGLTRVTLDREAFYFTHWSEMPTPTNTKSKGGIEC